MAGKRRKNNFFPVAAISLIAACIYRIILAHIIGSRGTAFFAVPCELFFMIAGSVSYGLAESVSVMTENRIVKGQLDGAKRTGTYAVYAGLFLGAVFTVLILIFASSISAGVLNLPLSYLGIMVIAPALLFMILTGALRGCFEGMGNGNLRVQSQVIFTFLNAVSGIIFAVVLTDYGKRVALILRREDLIYSYGALGAAAGILTASVLTFLHAVILYNIMQRRMVVKDRRENARYQDTPFSALLNILLNSLVPVGIYICFQAVQIINMGLFMGSGDENAQFLWGEYYGKSFPCAVLITLLICLYIYPYVRGAVSAVHREEYRNAREKLMFMIHRCAGVGIFVSAMILVLSDDVISMLFSNNSQMTVEYLKLQAVAMMFAVFAVCFTVLICLMKYQKLALIISGAAFVIRLVISFITVRTLGMGIRGAIIGNIVFYALIAAVSFMFVSRAFQYTQEWVRTFAVTIVAALISAVIGMLLNNAIASLVGKGVSLVITFIISTFVYMLILLALKGYTEDELLKSPLGRFMASMGSALRLL